KVRHRRSTRHRNEASGSMRRNRPAFEPVGMSVHHSSFLIDDPHCLSFPEFANYNEALGQSQRSSTAHRGPTTRWSPEMSRRRTMLFVGLLVAVISGVGIGQEVMGRSQAEGPAPGATGSDQATPSGIREDTWVAVGPNVRLKNGDVEVEARTLP